MVWARERSARGRGVRAHGIWKVDSPSSAHGYTTSPDHGVIHDRLIVHVESLRFRMPLRIVLGRTSVNPRQNIPIS